MQYNKVNNDEKQLIEELTRLNVSLQTELKKCHTYIQTLEKDLSEVQSNSNISIITDRQIERTLEQEKAKLFQDIQRLESKLRQKRHIIKKLEKHSIGLQNHINDISIQKGQQQNIISNLEHLLEQKIGQQRQKIGKLQSVILEQRQTIQLYCKQLQSKAVLTQKLYIKIDDFERQRGVIVKQNQDLRQINFNLMQVSHEQQIGFLQRQTKLNNEIKQLQKRLSKVLNEIDKLQSSQSIINQSSSRDTKQDNLKTTKLKQHMLVLEDQLKHHKQTIDRLKFELIATKLQNSNLLSKNSQLSYEVNKGEKTKIQLLNKFSNMNYIKNNSTQKLCESVKKSSWETTSRTASKRYLIKSDDGEIPVHDRASFNPNQQYLHNLIRTKRIYPKQRFGGQYMSST